MAHAAEPDPLLDALGRWADLGPEQLVLDGEKPYRTVVAAADREFFSADASFGALSGTSRGRSRPARVEAVIGSDARSSSRYRTGRVLGLPDLPDEDVAIAIDRDLWLALDTSFKASVKQLEVKTAALGQLASAWPPDRAPAMPTIAVDDARPEPVDRDALTARILTASAAFREFPLLRSGHASVSATDGRYLLATSDGTRLAQPEGYAAIYVWCEAVRPDGVLVWAGEQWVGRRAGDLPTAEDLASAARKLATEVSARVAAPVVEYYEGPVIFEGEAAIQLFAQLAVPETLGTPPAPPGDRTYSQLVRSGPRIGRHILPEGWSVADDPGDNPLVPAWDREGVPGQAVELVRDGVVVDLLMTEIPREDLRGSNGHARGDVQSAWTARPVAWTVTPQRVASDRAFDRAADRARSDARLDRILVVRALARRTEGTLPSPTRAVWRYADGHEEEAVGLEFQRADRRILRDISAATGPLTQTYLATEGGGGAGTTRGMPTMGTAPARVLVTEVEAVAAGGSEEPPAIPMPPLDP